MSWFNKGAEAADTLYAGTFFALLAGNLRRKNLGEGEFFKSDMFQHLRRTLNIELWLPQTDDRECQSSLLESTLRSSERYNFARYDLAPGNSKPEFSKSLFLSNFIYVFSNVSGEGVINRIGGMCIAAS